MGKQLQLGTESNVSDEDKAMHSVSENPVSIKLSELLYSLNYVAGDLKITCTESSLEGNFARVIKHISTNLSTCYMKQLLEDIAIKLIIPSEEKIIESQS